ncbi:hypothetical protein L3X38_016881 [Prunus dulcis]|uniref:Uncharacterized protein n=1 Tax=Prunus dulcis TaxID=3755 RepID=A0AAD4W644_PRUDU|nr:hypothetical protein L3X38_016881 [Prunus dulcis]
MTRAGREDCIESEKCRINYLYCGISENVPGYKERSDIRVDVLNKSCTAEGDNPPFNFGIFTEAISSKGHCIHRIFLQIFVLFEFNFIFPLQASLLLLPVVMIPETTDESPYGMHKVTG